MFIALIHWRIRPDPKSIAAFKEHWRTKNSIPNRRGLIGEFLSDELPAAKFPHVTWHLDSESLGNFRSFVTVGIWRDSASFKRQVGVYFNDRKPILEFEKYRRRRVAFKPSAWRVGQTHFPKADTAGVV